ncbi:hypothetical protein FB639_006619, partial [Coemansia asiatica]
MSDDSAENASALTTTNDSDLTASKQPTSTTLQLGEPVTTQLIQRLTKLEKYEHKLAEVARVYRNLNTARKAIETVLKQHTPVQSIADTEELEAHLSNLNLKTQYAGEQIGALTELDKNNKARIAELESQVARLESVAEEKVELARELERVSKERRVVEGQLERSNQKLRLDVGGFEEQVKGLQKRLEDAEKRSEESELMTVDGLAEKLISLVAEDPSGDMEASRESAAGTSAVLKRLCVELVDRLGVPEGLVAVDELDAHVQEIARLKDIVRKETDASGQ